MKNILIIGAGRSSNSLIQYLLSKAEQANWNITLADISLELAQLKINKHPRGKATSLNAIEDSYKRSQLIQEADFVVSMLPAHLHIHIAKDCLEYGKNMATASYVAPNLRALAADVKQKGLLFLCEIGLDPGIDHMSSMQLIDDIRKRGGKIEAFKSYTGGLVAPESDTNPWHYKFSWSPRNVVLAGQGVAIYQDQGQYKHVPYQQLFAKAESVEITGMGTYEAYPNRASLMYKEVYQLKDTPTLLRATLRHQGFCGAWNLLVQLGLTDDSYLMPYSDQLTYKEWIESYLPTTSPHSTENIRLRLAQHFGISVDDEKMDKLEWLGLFEEKKITLKKASPAQVLQYLLETKWLLQEEDKDMIIMQHELEYKLGEEQYQLKSTLVQKGENAESTAMANLVGLPLAIAVKNILFGKIPLTGIHIPISPQIYQPVMKELKEYGVHFVEKEVQTA